MGGRTRKDRNFFEVESKSAGALFIADPATLGNGFSASLELTFKECTEIEFKFGSRTK